MTDKLYTQTEVDKLIRQKVMEGQREIINGYILRLEGREVTIEQMLEWLWSDYDYIKGEEAVIAINKLI